MEYIFFINDIPIENFSEEDKNELLSQCLENGLNAIGYKLDKPRKRREINWDLYKKGVEENETSSGTNHSGR